MAKDPAVLFYTSDFLSKTEFFTFEQKGQYIHLLCVQHQNGHIPEIYMEKTLGDRSNTVWDKFKCDESGLWYQERMEEETERRKKYSKSRRDNVSNRYVDTYVDDMNAHMVTETETETETVPESLKEREEQIEEIKSKWNEFALENGLSQVIKLSSKRKSAVISRINEKEFDFDKILAEISVSDFCRGSTGWKVNFDFIFCSSNNYLKILEGRYRNAGTNSNTRKSDASQRAEYRVTPERLKQLEAISKSVPEGSQ